MCLAGAVVASWSLTQEVTGSSPLKDKYFLSLNSLNSVKTFRKNIIAGSLESAYSLNWGAREIWGKVEGRPWHFYDK